MVENSFTIMVKGYIDDKLVFIVPGSSLWVDVEYQKQISIKKKLFCSVKTVLVFEMYFSSILFLFSS